VHAIVGKYVDLALDSSATKTQTDIDNKNSKLEDMLEFIDEETISAFKNLYPFIVDMNNHIVELSTSNMKSKKNTIRKMSLNRLTKKIQYIDTFAMKYS
jgi:hypothetical protein